MGCDGGTIPRRDELVRKKEKPEQKDKNSELSFRWQHCSITQLPLQSPIVACGYGRLYNKDAVIEMLLDKANAPESAKHIKSLKDIKELQLTNNPAYARSAEKGDAYVDRQTAPYICPVIGLEMNGKFRFVFLWNCGCVFSERALKLVKTQTCHKCQKQFADDDVVVLNPVEEDMPLIKERLEKRHAKVKAGKKAHAVAKKTAETATSSSSSEKNTEVKQETIVENCKSDSGSSKIMNKQNGSKLSEKVPLKRSGNGQIEDPVFKKTKSSYSVAQDPKASEVYKSLFTSHHKANEQVKAHWITYNPFYN